METTTASQPESRRQATRPPPHLAVTTMVLVILIALVAWHFLFPSKENSNVLGISSFFKSLK